MYDRLHNSGKSIWALLQIPVWSTRASCPSSWEALYRCKLMGLTRLLLVIFACIPLQGLVVYHPLTLTSSCCYSVAKSCPALCDSMDCSTPDLPVPHHLLELAQVHVHWIGDAIQPSHPLSPSSPSAFGFSQHQGLFQ